MGTYPTNKKPSKWLIFIAILSCMLLPIVKIFNIQVDGGMAILLFLIVMIVLFVVFPVMLIAISRKDDNGLFNKPRLQTTAIGLILLFISFLAYMFSRGENIVSGTIEKIILVFY